MIIEQTQLGFSLHPSHIASSLLYTNTQLNCFVFIVLKEHFKINTFCTRLRKNDGEKVLKFTAQ